MDNLTEDEALALRERIGAFIGCRDGYVPMLDQETAVDFLEKTLAVIDAGEVSSIHAWPSANGEIHYQTIFSTPWDEWTGEGSTIAESIIEACTLALGGTNAKF